MSIRTLTFKLSQRLSIRTPRALRRYNDQSHQRSAITDNTIVVAIDITIVSSQLSYTNIISIVMANCNEYNILRFTSNYNENVIDMTVDELSSDAVIESRRNTDSIEMLTYDNSIDCNDSSSSGAQEKSGDVLYPLHLTSNEVTTSIERADLPEADSILQFIESPHLFRPKLEFIDGNINEEELVLIYAVRLPSEGAVLELLKAGANPNLANKKGATPLAAASHKGNVRIMKYLIDAGAQVNAYNSSSGSTPLIQAAHFGHLEAVQLLLHHNASGDFHNLKGTTALMRASQEGHLEISRSLIIAGADVNRKNHEGMNALMLASQRGHASMACLLVKAGADIDEQTAQGSTALMLACKRGHRECVDVLVSLGAEVCMRDCRSRNAKETASKKSHTELLELLETQYQIRKIQQFKRFQRTQQIMELRSAFATGYLQANVNNQVVTLMTSCKLNAFDKLTTSRLSTMVNNFDNFHMLCKCMLLPQGVFDLIVDMIPAPRVWQWSIYTLRRRCKLDPKNALMDISVLMDEILCDACVIPGGNQCNLLIRIASDAVLQKKLVEEHSMQPSLISLLIKESATQIYLRSMTDSEVTYKSPRAKNMLDTAVLLFKWYRYNSNYCSDASLQIHVHTKLSTCYNSIRHMELVDAPDISAEDEANADMVLTETEMPVDGDIMEDDSESDR